MYYNLKVNALRFEWDAAKNLSNQLKHGVSFEDAALVFNPLHLSWKERVQDGEERWQTYGRVERLVLLVVVHTFREKLEDGKEIELVRVISARKAEPKERRRYEKENG